MALWSINGPDRELWTVDDVRRHFGWSRAKLYRLIRRGWFPAGKDVGGRPCWTGEEIAAYLLLAGRWRPEGSEGEPEPESEGDEE